MEDLDDDEDFDDDVGTEKENPKRSLPLSTSSAADAEGRRAPKQRMLDSDSQARSVPALHACNVHHTRCIMRHDGE